MFPTCDAAGAELLAQIERALAPVVRPLDLNAVWSPAQSALIRSIVTADVTVLDLTPGPEAPTATS